MKNLVGQIVLTVTVVIVAVLCWPLGWSDSIPFLVAVSLATWIDGRVGTVQQALLIHRQAKDANVQDVVDILEGQS